MGETSTRRRARPRVGSVGYIAPEVLTLPCPPQTTQVDCFSAGVLLYTCLAGHGPFQGRNLKEVLVQNLHNSVNMQAMTRFPPGARDLVTQLLETRPEDRPTAGQCLRHPWLRRPRDANSLKVPPRNPFSSCTLESLGETTSRFSHSHGCSMSKASSNRTLSSSSRSSSSSEQSGAEDHGPLNTQPYFPSKSQDSLSVLAVMAATERSSQRVEASGHSARGTASWPHGPVSVAGKQLAKSLSQSISYDFLQPRPSAADGTRSAPVRRALAAGSAGRAPPAGAAGRAARAAGGAPWAAVRGAPADHAQGLQGSGALAARILRVRHRAPLDSGTEASDSEEGPEEEEHCSHGCSVSKTVGPEAARADAGANSSKEARAEAPGERLSGRLSFRGLRQRVAEARSAKGHVPVPRFLLGVGMRPRTSVRRRSRTPQLRESEGVCAPSALAGGVAAPFVLSGGLATEADSSAKRAWQLRRLAQKLEAATDKQIPISFLECAAGASKAVVSGYSQLVGAAPIHIDAKVWGWVSTRRLFWTRGQHGGFHSRSALALPRGSLVTTVAQGRGGVRLQLQATGQKPLPRAIALAPWCKQIFDPRLTAEDQRAPGMRTFTQDRRRFRGPIQAPELEDIDPEFSGKPAEDELAELLASGPSPLAAAAKLLASTGGARNGGAQNGGEQRGRTNDGTVGKSIRRRA
ncbi:unnamed protein product [Prorocentrum cordatum]|uniref:Protein kinase domain-containing protein n=1 Tax=Prorocentrum cordatum TaxID=2364126 RepID=A0ABN9U4C7_9DINO|nr:unnamed protein product [Polarella glacialis]